MCLVQVKPLTIMELKPCSPVSLLGYRWAGGGGTRVDLASKNTYCSLKDGQGTQQDIHGKKWKVRFKFSGL